MRLRIGWIFTGLALIAAASSPAQAGPIWTGPGWYLEETESGFDETLISGPYADEDACNAVRPPDNQDYNYLCEYEGTDPTVAPPPQGGV